MTIYLLLVFLSGISALIFENLWFRLAGLLLGNSVWSSALVLAGFMSGLALGNLIATRLEARVRRPLRLYSGLELCIGLSGLGLVLLLPDLTTLLLPWMQAKLGSPVQLNLLRLTVAFLLLLVPTTAMGATLPVLMKHLAARSESFGERLGGVYGANTLGAVLGVLACEILLVPSLGVRGSGLVAAGLNGAVAIASVLLWSREAGSGPQAAAEPAAPVRASHSSMALLVAAFLLGAVFLALEVVWFRFQLLFFSSVSINFALMLAVVLGGMAMGGLAASILFRRVKDPVGLIPAAAFLCGISLVASYGLFHRVLDFAFRLPILTGVFTSTAFLALPVSVLSGFLFTLIGQALHRNGYSQGGATGLLTACNTIGATAGSFAAGFYLISRLGIEKCFLLFAVIYGIAALLLVLAGLSGDWPARRKTSLLTGMAFLVSLFLFPFGRMEGKYLQVPVSVLNEFGEKRVAFREGQLETIQYLLKTTLGRPDYFRMVTNNHSMSASDPASRRYMRLFSNFATVLHPAPRTAALLCVGVGNTAKALTEDPRLQSIDVVDISRDVVEMTSVVYPDPSTNPLKDPRVRVHLEDGRFFLMTAREHYDVITAEPPPPHHAGVSSLYSREFFQLAKERLAPGGMLTYWLPVHDLRVAEAKAILQAFLAAFPDGSLWAGSGLNWMMVGCKPPFLGVTEAAFRSWWAQPAWASHLDDLGLPAAEDLGALFIADGERLRNWLGATPPLTENWPQRINAAAWQESSDSAAFLEFMNPKDIRRNFQGSPTLKSLLPEGLHPGSSERLDRQFLVNAILTVPGPADIVRLLHQRPQDPLLIKVAFWRHYFDFDRADRILAAEPGLQGEGFAEHRAQLALRSGALVEAAGWLAKVDGPRSAGYLSLRIYCLQRAGDAEGAQRLAGYLLAHTPAARKPATLAFLAWVAALPTASRL